MHDDYCNATPLGNTWPVCALPPGHGGEHESADYHWEDGALTAKYKG